jgi:glycosyltransferase involved in cell wall biosynthesis
MVTRRKIGLLYQYDENWIGGTYYIQNLIFACNRLEEAAKPYLIIICSDRIAYEKLQKLTGYPFMQRRALTDKVSILNRILNKLSRTFFNKNICKVVRYNKFADIDLLFPGIDHPAFIHVLHKLYWIPDLQEHFYPNFFTANEREMRIQQQKKMVEENACILFSSKEALSQFNHIYPANTNKKFVMPFAVNFQHLHKVSFEELSNQYKIKKPYFICSNQFWQHKNHRVIFEAIQLLKKKGVLVNLVLTGNENDYRDKMYFQKLKNSVGLLNIENETNFLGFIHRADQIALLQHAQAVIQPSLFEGWSTVVEDAKALNIWVICSAIAVHKEQLEDYPNCSFFPAQDAYQLSIQMESFLGEPTISFYDYTIAQKRHTLKIKEVFDSICN